MRLRPRLRRGARFVRSELGCTLDAVAGTFAAPAVDKAALRGTPIVEQIEAVLRQDMLVNWFPRVIDRDRGGYLENFDRRWRPNGDGRKSLIYQSRIAWAAAAFAQYAPEHAEAFGAHAVHGIDFIDRTLRDPEHGSFYLSVDAGGVPFRDGDLLVKLVAQDRRPAKIAQGGYAMEAAAFLLEAAAALGAPGDATAWHAARRLVDRALHGQWDDRRGGVHARTRSGELVKDWWAQAESLRALASQWRFIFEHFIDGRYGGWYRQTHLEGRTLGPHTKAQSWQACYHTGRALMEVSKRLRSQRRKGLVAA